MGQAANATAIQREAGSGPGWRPSAAEAALLAAFVLSAAVYLLVYRLSALAALGPLRNLIATLLATAPLLLANWSSQRLPLVSPRVALGLLLGSAAVLRLCVPLNQLVGSDDAYRYLWDGLVQAAGHNPYDHAPVAPALEALRDEVLYPNVFRPDMRTVYPPLAQLWFLLAHLLGGGGFVGLKLLYLLNDLAGSALLVGLLRQRSMPPLQALLFAWSPLVIVQSQAAGHLDSLLVPWLLLAFLLAETRPGLAGAALGCACMVRPLAALCGPALALRRPARQALWTSLGFGIVCAAFVLPYARAGVGLVESLMVYAEHWRFNGSLFRPLDLLWGQHSWFRPALYALIGAGACGVAAVPVSRATRGLLALGLYFALAPTVYPWYLLAPLALLALHRGPLVLLLPALITLSDLVFVDGAVGGAWEVPRLVLWLEYLGIYGLALWQLARHRRLAPRIGRRYLPFRDQS